jgi:hypothetical protein
MDIQRSEQNKSFEMEQKRQDLLLPSVLLSKASYLIIDHLFVILDDQPVATGDCKVVMA